MSSEFVIRSVSMIRSSGKRSFEAFESPLTVRKCAQICFLSLELLMDSEKYLRFSALINCLGLFRYSNRVSLVTSVTGNVHRTKLLN